MAKTVCPYCDYDASLRRIAVGAAKGAGGAVTFASGVIVNAGGRV